MKLTSCSAVPHSKCFPLGSTNKCQYLISITLRQQNSESQLECTAKGTPNDRRRTNFGRRMWRKPPKAAENYKRGEGPRRGRRPTYRQRPNFRADASRESGFPLGAGVELGESFSAPAGPALIALGGETAVNAGFGRRKISWSLGDTIRARTTVVAPISVGGCGGNPRKQR